MSSKVKSTTGSSRFKPQVNLLRSSDLADLSNDCVRFKTEDGEGEGKEKAKAKPEDSKRFLTSRNATGASLQQLIREGSKRRKVCLEKIVPQYKPIMKPVLLQGRHELSKQEKENVKRSLLEAINPTPKKSHKLTQHYEKMVRASFDRIVKEIKHKKCIRRDDETELSRAKIEAHAATIKGQKHANNQDSYAFSDGIYIICDGHGTNGKQISEFVSSLAHKLLQEAMSEHRMDQAVIRQVLKKVEGELDLFGIDIAFSGCTFIGVVIWENTVFAINVGDSRAILCRGLTITGLSVLHKPDSPLERQRIELCGGVIHPLEIGKDKFSGPNRIWAPGRCSWGPGLALSRAFGDKAARKFGVISEPEIKTVSLTYEDDFILLGSDGLFDCLKDSDLSLLVRKQLKEEGRREELAGQLAEEARRAAGPQADDITCIIVFLCWLGLVERLQFKMGSGLEGQRVLARSEGRLRFILKISAEELASLREIVNERASFKYQYLCTVETLQHLEEPTPNIFCENYSQVAIDYEPYDCLLHDLTPSYPLPQLEVERIIFAVCSALQFLEGRKCRHGDISARMICRLRNEWRLIDNYFVKGGITAYEKVLEGEVGFISPAQMEKIRHGFVRESPPIEESDDVFALGMTCLEVMSGRPSSSCYKESYIRFNEKSLNDSRLLVQHRYPPPIGNLVFAMIDPNEDKRITLSAIMSQPIISRHSKKYSLRTPNGK